ncbi:MAG: hypothetical protein WB791_11095 [Waddliaceae bacterium]
MNKMFFVILTAACGLFFLPELIGKDSSSVDDIPELFICRPVDLCQSYESIDCAAIAKFHNVYMLTEDTETRIVSYLKDDRSKITFHVGWYADGFIMTQINGQNEGHQTVFLGNDIRTAEVIGSSYPCRQDDATVHKYSWGKVVTCQYRQSVVTNNPPND